MKDYHAFWILMGVLAVLALLQQTAWGVMLFMLLATASSAGVAGYGIWRYRQARPGIVVNIAWAVLMAVAAFTAPPGTTFWLLIITGAVNGAPLWRWLVI